MRSINTEASAARAPDGHRSIHLLTSWGCAASHCSRVPVACFVIAFVSFLQRTVDIAVHLFYSVFIFAVGIPAIRGLLVITGALGILGSGLVLYWHRRHALKIQSLHLDEEKQNRRG